MSNQINLKKENQLDCPIDFSPLSSNSHISSIFTISSSPKISPSASPLSKTSKSSKSTIDNPDNIIFNIKWSTRDQIVKNISTFSSMLCGRELNLDDKQNLVKSNNELLLNLISLSMDDDKKMKKKLELINDDLIDVETADGDVCLKINWALRDRIIFLLIKNYNFTILFPDRFSDETKSSLLNDNNDLISHLLNLWFSPTKANDYSTRGGRFTCSFLNASFLIHSIFFFFLQL